MRKIKLIVVLFVLVFVVGCFSVFASTLPTNVQSWWMVDSGGKMDWGGSTRYQSEFNYAVGVWNAHRNVIREVKLNTMRDVGLGDYNDNRDESAAHVQPKFPIVNGGFYARRMRFNQARMDNYTLAQKRMVALHELGHTLGVDHISGDNVMHPNIISRITLSDNDKAAANRAWNYHR